MATYKITFKNKKDGTLFNMMFGDSYKSWKEQRDEFLRIHKDDVEEIRTYKSYSHWKSWGGLKWCSEDSFQEELNREGVQQNEPDNPNARQYKDFKFFEI